MLLPRLRTPPSSVIDKHIAVAACVRWVRGEAAQGHSGRRGQGGSRRGRQLSPLLLQEPSLASTPVPTGTAPFPGSWQRGGLPKELCPRAPACSWAGGRPSPSGLTQAHTSSAPWVGSERVMQALLSSNLPARLCPLFIARSPWLRCSWVLMQSVWTVGDIFRIPGSEAEQTDMGGPAGQHPQVSANVNECQARQRVNSAREGAVWRREADPTHGLRNCCPHPPL